MEASLSPSPSPSPSPSHSRKRTLCERLTAEHGRRLSLHAFPVKTLPVASASHRHRDSRSTLAAANLRSPALKLSCDFASCVSTGSILPRGGGRAAGLRARAVTDDDEWGREAPDGPQGAGAAVAEAEESAADAVIGELKTKLKELLYGTDRGLKVSSETRAEIVELITQLESRNPTPAPTEALPPERQVDPRVSFHFSRFISPEFVRCQTILRYTSFSGLLPLLATNRVPQLVKVEEISQTIDSESFTVQNSVRFAGPLATTSVSTNAKFEVRSPKRVQIKFEEGIVGTPQLTDSIVVPEKVEFFGQNVDLSPFKGIITSIQDAASSVAKSISDRPPLKIPITNTNAESWLLTTYLDNELRVSRVMGAASLCSSRKVAPFWINTGAVEPHLVPVPLWILTEALIPTSGHRRYSTQCCFCSVNILITSEFEDQYILTFPSVGCVGLNLLCL
ncbi:unnamed protein product [Spirodela intermedia]|uniref:Plastid lipid-associated protein/fibrillin conserved domain-containing protein n=1 Tax=Spirodela intermedia TaxID=51605 RepID=A0A7I8IW60_SPIIN|nr:unnamed protein product [Spirodela intermedia]CAA6661391.1 unnamed protein product [Spirodela intermedia]